MSLRVVMFSGGIASFLAATRVPGDLVLLFADTSMEDEDLYRFVREADLYLDQRATLVTLRDGRTPWQVFRDVRFLGNTRVDPCSRILKREPMRRWLEQNCDPDSTTVYLGMDWTEGSRIDRAREHWLPWRVEYPLCDPPLLTRAEMLEAVRALGIEPPRLYAMGFPHNNCGGFCVKAGQAQFAHLLKTMPESYAEHEREEESLRSLLGDVAILRDRRGGATRPLTMHKFRQRVDSGQQIELDWAGCSCLLPDAAPAPEEP